MPTYTYGPAPVLVEATGEFAIGATGVLRPLNGGEPVPIYDLNDSPIATILVGPKGGHQAFKADIASGLLDFGSVLLPRSSKQVEEAIVAQVDIATDALVVANAASATAASAAATAEEALGYAQGDAVTAVAAAPAVNPTGVWNFAQSPTVAGSPLRQEATDTESGVVTLATADEVIAGQNSEKVVTPASLAARTATTGRTGLARLATSAEALAGTDTTKATTPAAVKAVADTKVTADGANAVKAGITQTAYDALATKVGTTLYFIV